MFIDTIMSAKGNIPILETQHLVRSKPATETQPKPINQASPLSTGTRNSLTTNNIVIKNVSGNKTKNIDDRRVDTKIQENKIEDEVQPQIYNLRYTCTYDSLNIIYKLIIIE